MHKTVKMRLDRIISSYEEREETRIAREQLRKRADNRFAQAFCARSKTVITPSLQEAATYLRGRWPQINLEIEESLKLDHPFVAATLNFKNEYATSSLLGGRPDLRFRGDIRTRRVCIERDSRDFIVRRPEAWMYVQLHWLNSEFVQTILIDVLQEFVGRSSKGLGSEAMAAS